MKLSRAIVLLVFAVAAVPTSLLLAVTSIASRRALLADARELTRERADRLRLRIADRLDGTVHALALAARHAGFDSPQDRQRELQTLLAQREELDGAALYDASGHPLHDARAAAPGVTAEDAALDAITGLLPVDRPTFGPVRRDPASGRLSLPLALPLPGGRSGGAPEYLGASVSLRGIEDLVARQMIGTEGVGALLLGRGGEPLAARGPLASAALPAASAALARERAALEASGEVRAEELPAGVPAIAAYAVVPRTGWGVVVFEPRARALSLVRWVQGEGALGLLLGLLLSIGLGLLFARAVVRPVRAVVRGALDISRGQFGTEIPLTARNELGDLAHTFNYMSKQLQAYDQETRGLYRSLEEGYVETIVALANSIDSKDSYTRGHSQRVADISRAIGEELGLPDRTLKHLYYGGILHDIGKIGIPERILLKQSVLTTDEMRQMREHPAIGASIVGAVAFLAPAAPAVRSHHERWDGKGYPDGLSGESIPLVARIVNVADTWDACTSTRPYQEALAFEAACAVLRKLAGSQCDPEVVEALMRALDKRRATGRTVVPASGQRARAAHG